MPSTQGWDTSHVHEVTTSAGQIRTSVSVKTNGDWAGMPIMAVRYPDGTWSATWLCQGAILASVRNQPSRREAWRMLRMGLAIPVENTMSECARVSMDSLPAS
jgi:hypothetical protein